MKENDTEDNKNQTDDQSDSANNVGDKSTEKSTDNPCQDKNITEPFWKKPININWTNFFHFLIVVVTAIYALFACFQWKTLEKQSGIIANQVEVMKDQSSLIREQIESTKQQFTLENRAWINISDATHSEFKAGEKVVCKITVTNSGKSPALKTRIHAQIRIFKEPVPSTLPITPPREKGFSEIVLGPSIQVTNNIGMRHPITEEIIEAIKQHTVYLFVWGTITYDDTLGNHHTTTFCLVNGNGPVDFDGCSGNNTMD